jgi:hypothetical protein
MGLLGYDLWKRCSLWAGYRALAYDKWERQQRGLDIIFHARSWFWKSDSEKNQIT